MKITLSKLSCESFVKLLLCKRNLIFFIFLGLAVQANSTLVHAEANLDRLLYLIADVPEGEWIKVNTNKFQDVWTPTSLRPLAGPSNPFPEKIISAWSSFAWDSTRGDLIIYGGGHGNYSGNDVYRWRSATQQWERASLPSQVTVDTANQDVTVDGPDYSPASAHTYDNNVYLPNIDRFMTFGGAKYGSSGAYAMDRGDGKFRPTGPYIFDLSKADANMVGGLTGSHVMRVAAFPEILGGEMWKNRDIYKNLGISPMKPSTFIDGTTAVVSEFGVDVVYVTAPVNQSSTQYLYKYTVNSLNDPTQDTWEQVGIEFDAFNGQGAGAFDSELNLFVRSANSALTYWDLSAAGPSNRNRNFRPTSIGETFTLSGAYGMDYDVTRNQFLFWGGGGKVWALKSPGTVSPTGWTVTKQPTPTTSVPATIIPTGVLGKWKYIAQLDAFIGLANSNEGNVWIYKPIGWKNPITGEQYLSPEITTRALDSTLLGDTYSSTLKAYGSASPFIWSIIAGNLPNGLILDETGVIAGISEIVGIYSFTVQVTDQEGSTAVRDFSLEVKDIPTTFALFKDDFSRGTLGDWSQLKSGQIRMVNDPTEGWVIRKSGADDPNGGWVALDATVGDFELVIYTRKVNTVGGSWIRYSVTNEWGNGYGVYLSYNSSDLGVERRDNWFSIVKQTAEGTLPGGMQLGQWYTLRISRQGDQITTEVFADRIIPSSEIPLLQTTMTDAKHQNLTQININGGRDFDTGFVQLSEQPVIVELAVKTDSLPNVNVGDTYLQELTAIGGLPTYTWDIIAGSLPDGLVLGSSGQISGIANVPGIYTFTVQVTDAEGAIAISKLSVTSEQTVIDELVITTDSLASTVVDSPYSYELAAVGGIPEYTWEIVAGALPEGLVMNSSGQISGTPYIVDEYFFTVQVSDQNNTLTLQELSLAVNDVPNTSFEDDFNRSDLGDWSQLKSGQIRMVNDPTEGWVIRKSGADDPNGGWVALDATVGDFELVIYTRKVNTVGGSWIRYSVTNEWGNGYGVYLSYNSSDLGVERRDNWFSIVKQTAEGTLPGGMQLGQWYTLRISRQGDQITTEVFADRIIPSSEIPLLQTTMTDAKHQNLTQININGGRDFDTSYIALITP